MLHEILICLREKSYILYFIRNRFQNVYNLTVYQIKYLIKMMLMNIFDYYI